MVSSRAQMQRIFDGNAWRVRGRRQCKVSPTWIRGPALPTRRPVKGCAALRLQGDLMRLRPLPIALLAVLATALIGARAAAQDKAQTQSRDESYFAAKLMLGIGGDVDAS